MKTLATNPIPAPSNTRLTSQFGDPNGGLRSLTELIGSAVVIHVGGDIDASNDNVWQRMVSRTASIASAPGPFVIDVRELDFIGSCAYVAIANEAVRCGRRGVELRLVSTQPIVARTIAACGLGRLLPLYASVETALLSDR